MARPMMGDTLAMMFSVAGERLCPHDSLKRSFQR